MGRAVRFWTRALAFAILRVSRLGERVARSLAYATFTPAEVDSLGVAEWEAFGERGMLADDQLLPWESELFARHIRAGDSILVVGAGSGRDVLPFLEAGHEVTALDVTPRALESLVLKARARGRTVSTHHASIVDAVLPSAVFDVVLFSWFALGYVRSAKARASALSRSLQTLRPGGRILVSYQVRAEKPPAMSRIAQKVARAIGGVEVERGDEFNISGTAARPGVFFLHRFEPQEIADEARDAGLSVLDHTQPTNNVGVIVLVRSSQDS